MLGSKILQETVLRKGLLTVCVFHLFRQMPVFKVTSFWPRMEVVNMDSISLKNFSPSVGFNILPWMHGFQKMMP